jgi:hypothetical protein
MSLLPVDFLSGIQQLKQAGQLLYQQLGNG